MRSTLAMAALVVLGACSGSTPAPIPDAGRATSDAGPTDAGRIEPHPDAGPVDAGIGDAGFADAGFVDAGPDDAGAFDAGPIDAGPVDAGPIDAGPVDAGPIDAGPGCGVCPSGLCFDDGGCASCADDSQCSDPTPRCDPASFSCAACIPGPTDNCPVHAYCSDARQCVAGCDTGPSCASGSCLASHDCEGCVGDLECASGNVCDHGVCGPPCTATSCVDALACCTGHCVDLVRDEQDCGACGVACDASEFCDGTSCIGQVLTNTCAEPQVTVILDDQGGDDPISLELAAAFEAACSPSPLIRVVDQSDGGVLDPVSGAPEVGASELLAVAGGPYVQRLVGYLDSSGLSPVTFQGTPTTSSFVLRDGGVVVTEETATLDGGGHDDFVVQLVKDPASGTLSLVVYGFNVPGTAAGGWYLINEVLPQLSSYGERWYVVAWTDGDGDGLPSNASEFTVLAQGS